MDGLWFFRPVRNLMRIFSKERSPTQIALAIALGMLVGLLPKGNLLAVSATVLLLSLRVNLGVGLTTAFIVSLAYPWTAPLAHEFGMRALHIGSVYQGLSQLYQLPVFPWTSLNHSIVLGSLILGTVLFYPTFHFSRLLVGKWQSKWRERSSSGSPANRSIATE